MFTANRKVEKNPVDALAAIVSHEILKLERRLDHYHELQNAAECFLAHTKDNANPDVIRMRLAISRLNVPQ